MRGGVLAVADHVVDMLSEMCKLEALFRRSFAPCHSHEGWLLNIFIPHGLYGGTLVDEHI